MNENTSDVITSVIRAAALNDSNIRTLESIKISDTVQSWLTMLNTVIAMCNIVEHPQSDPKKCVYENLFGFMSSDDKLYLDRIREGIVPEILADGETVAVNAVISSLKTRNITKMVDAFEVPPENQAGHSGTVYVNEDSIDVQCIDASRDIEIILTSSTSSRYYAEKLVSIKADSNLCVEYNGTGDFAFVNNSIYPNVVYSAINTPRKTLLLAGHSLVYKFIFIHSKILIEVVENTQLIDNYLAQSEKSFNREMNGVEAFRASSPLCEALAAAAAERNEEGTAVQKTLWITGIDSMSETLPEDGSAVARFQTVFEYRSSEASPLDRARLRCEAVLDGTRRTAQYKDLEDGTNSIEFESDDHTAIVQVEYYLNMLEARFILINLAVFVRDNGRMYDE